MNRSAIPAPMKKSEETQCPMLGEVTKRSPSNIVTCEVFWCSCISFKSVLVFFLVVPSWVAPGLCTKCICWRCCRRLLRRSTKFLASTDCPWFVRLRLRVFWNCPATSRTRSAKLLVCCSCSRVERLGAVLIPSYSSDSSQEHGN